METITIEQVAEKFKSSKQGFYSGVGFVNNVKTYQYADGIFFSNGNERGDPLKDNVLFFFCTKTGEMLYVTFEFIMNNTQNSFNKFLNDTISK